jgi:hypothetical protein
VPRSSSTIGGRSALPKIWNRAAAHDNRAVRARGLPRTCPTSGSGHLIRYRTARAHTGELLAFFGSRQRVHDILRRKQRLSLEQVRALHEKLSIPAEVLIDRSRHIMCRLIHAIEMSQHTRRFRITCSYTRNGAPASGASSGPAADVRDHARGGVRRRWTARFGRVRRGMNGVLGWACAVTWQLCRTSVSRRAACDR